MARKLFDFFAIQRTPSVVAVASAILLSLAVSPARANVVTGNPGGACVPAAADYDGDGDTDYSQLCGGAWFFYNDTGGLIKSIWVGDVAGQRPVPADWNGDGADEPTVWRTGAYYFFSYTTTLSTGAQWIGDPGSCQPAPGDFDGDGLAKISQLCNGAWYFFTPAGVFIKSIWIGNVAGQIAVPADYQGTGASQVVAFRNGAWEFWSYATGVGTGGVWTTAGTHPAPLDYNGDGKTDFTVYNGGAWYFFNAVGASTGSVWTGNVAGDVPISSRIAVP